MNAPNTRPEVPPGPPPNAALVQRAAAAAGPVTATRRKPSLARRLPPGGARAWMPGAMPQRDRLQVREAIEHGEVATVAGAAEGTTVPREGQARPVAACLARGG